MMIELNALKEFCASALEKEGMNPDHARMVSQVLAETDAYGTHSHGTKNLHNYIRKARSGGLNLKAEPKLITEGPAFAVMDADNAMGMVAGVMGMNLACEKAKEAGLGLVTVKNSSHFGAVGYYVNLAASKGMIGIAFSNVDPNMNAPGARGKAIGNNPLGYASPSRTMPSVFLDIALSNVASLKVFQARAEGRSIPDTWIVDKNGLPTRDPSAYPEEGAMQPMAAHKGYGLAVMVDLLTAILSGGPTSMSGEIASWILDMESPNRVSHTFMAIDASQFLGQEDALAASTEKMAETLRALPKAEGVDRIYLPGEMEWERHEKAREQGLRLPEDLLESLKELADDLELELPLLPGDE